MSLSATRLLFVATSFGLLLGCGSKRPAKTAHAHAADVTSGVERYMPLKDDTVYAYRTTVEETGEHGVLMLHVQRSGGGLVELSVGGKVQRLEILKNAIRNLDGGFLLKAPLVMGATWPGTGGQVQVKAVDQAVKVPAGSFTGCIETVEQQALPRGQKKITTTYCPHVGIVRLDVEAQAGTEYQAEHAVLRSFGKRIDLGATAN